MTDRMTNSEQKLSSEVIKMLGAREDAYQELLQLDQENDKLNDLQAELANSRREIYESMFSPLKMQVAGSMDRLQGIMGSYDKKAIILALEKAALRKKIYERQLLNLNHFNPGVITNPPKPIDSNFWWAETVVFGDAGFNARFSSGVLLITEGPTHQDDSDIKRSFGARARFTLSHDRMPATSSGQYLSSPHIDLMGGITVHCPDYSLFQGHAIAGCQLFLRQTLFQFGFGQNGPGALVVGESVEQGKWSLFMEDTGLDRELALPGFFEIPPVIFNKSQLTPDTLFAEIEVRFDVHLKRAGALVWADPFIRLATFQWPLVERV